MKSDIRPTGHAKLSYLRISPRKVRLVANLVRGKDVAHAERQLQVLPKRAARPILKLLRSALSNTEEKEKGLYVSQIRVDQGPPYKRGRSRARGRVFPIHKMTSHVHIEVAEKNVSK